MDIENEILNALQQIPRIQESHQQPTLDDLIIGGKLGLDSFDFAELVILLAESTGRDPFTSQDPSREIAKTFRDLARFYA